MSVASTYFSNLKEYKTSFWMLCIHMLLFAASFNMLIPELNSYLTELGREDLIWMNLGLWTIAAAISRPFSGKIADNISRKSVMFIGVLVSIIICFIYPLLPYVLGFLILRFLHGFSTGFQPTGATALVADVIPKGKRGEAMGIFGITITVGFSLGQGMGSIIKTAVGMQGLFLIAGIVGMISFLLILTIKEDKEVIRKNCEDKGYTTLWEKILPKWDEIFGIEVIQPSVMIFLTASLFGFFVLLIPELSTHLGIENKGLFFAVHLPFVVIMRFVAGKLTDKYGARRNLFVSLIFLGIGCVLTAYCNSLNMLIVCSIVYGIGAAISSPAVFAWTADLANPVYKGRGMGTMFIFLELGIFSGNYVGQKIYQNQVENLPTAFMVGAFLCVFGMLFLAFTYKRKS
ncbi:MAG: MFS transporter [Flavobacteriales bacterium]|nr:MFS transporter [Flavobacteriales bacterium]